MTFSLIYRPVLLLAFCALLTANALRAAEGVPANLESAVTDIVSYLSENSGRELKSEEVRLLRFISEGAIDYTSLAKRALGKYWKKFSQDEQAQFMELFPDLIVQSYAENYSGQSQPTVQWMGVRELKKEQREVRSQVVISGQKFEVVYRVRAVDAQKWMAYDIIVEGVSLVSNYRSQFASILRRGKPADLIAKLDAMVNPS